jgi:acyl carrier protein
MSGAWPAEFELLMRRHCRFVEPHEQLDSQAPMHMLGADSLEIVELIVDLEEEFGISFSENLLTPQVFATPTSIWGAIELLCDSRQVRGS